MLSGRDAELGQHMRSLIHAGDEPVAMRDALGRLESFNKVMSDASDAPW